MQTPQNIRVLKEDGILELVWKSDDVSRIPFRAIRQGCRCAACVDEMTGRQVLDPHSVDIAIYPEDVALAGNYALKIRWSDTHDSGLFTWDHLRSIDNRLQAQASEN